MPHGQLWCRENRLSLNRHKGQFFAGDREAFLHVGNSTGDHPKSAATGERRTLPPFRLKSRPYEPLIRQGAFTLIRVRTIRDHLERKPHGRNLGVASPLFRIGEQLEGFEFLLEMRRRVDEEIPPCFERFQVERLLRFLNVQHLVAKATRDRTPVQGFCANGIAQPFGGRIFGIGESVESGAETGVHRLCAFKKLLFWWYVLDSSSPNR